MRPSALLQIVGFHDCDPDRVILAAHNGGVVIGWERGYDGRFQIVGRWNCRSADVGFLSLAGLIVNLPVVVGHNHGSTCIVQLKRRISQPSWKGITIRTE